MQKDVDTISSCKQMSYLYCVGQHKVALGKQSGQLTGTARARCM
jgi:hypothetical protein